MSGELDTEIFSEFLKLDGEQRWYDQTGSGPDMSETQDVIEVMARVLEQVTLNPSIDWADIAADMLPALASAGYRLAGPGECVVPEEPTEVMLDAGANRWDTHHPGLTENYPNERATWRAMLSAVQKKAPGSGEASEGSKDG